MWPALSPAVASRIAEASERVKERVHKQLASEPDAQCELSTVGALALYYHCVAKASRLDSDATRAQQWREQLTDLLLPPPLPPWLSTYLDQVCLLAWLMADSLPASLGQFAPLDHAMEREGKYLLKRSDAESRQRFFQVLRYFSLRLPDPAPQLLLQTLLDAWPGALAPAPALLSLVHGTAAELLVCLRLVKAGGGTAALEAYIREGVRHLLAAKRPVDSSQQQYAIFPDKAGQHQAEAQFSAELSWRRGDLGQALVLYEAHALLLDPELVKFAHLVGLYTLLRTTTATTEVQGISLYQGATGVAHLYRHLYRQSNLPAYLKGYEFWLDSSCQLLDSEGNAAATSPPLADPLRYGLVGTGLVLLSANTGLELGWEEVLI